MPVLFLCIKRGIAVYIRLFLYYLFRVFPVDNHKICVTSYNGKGYGDNPKYLVAEIIRRNLNYKIVWCVRDEFRNSMPPAVKTVRYKSIQSIFEEATAKIWIDNCRKQLYVRKRAAQYYIQTWHGAVNLKKVEKDAENQLSAYYIQQAINDSKLIDLFLSDSAFASHIYRTAFWYDGDIFECGCPRDDILINPVQAAKEKARKYFNIADDAKIVLYAPTFRDTFDMEIYTLNYEAILGALREKTNGRWIFLMRLHPNISEKSKSFAYNNTTIYNATHYDDMQELMLASDMLITDYSDCMYEFALTRKPVFLYIRDYEAYKKERGFYFDLCSLPFPRALTTPELIEKMIQFNHEDYARSLTVFFEKIGMVKDGRASERVVNKMLTETKGV